MFREKHFVNLFFESFFLGGHISTWILDGGHFSLPAFYIYKSSSWDTHIL